MGWCCLWFVASTNIIDALSEKAYTSSSGGEAVAVVVLLLIILVVAIYVLIIAEML